MIVDYLKNPKLYANIYAQLEISKTQFLAFRDLPKIFKQYVQGTVALDYGSGAGKSTKFLKSLGFDVKGVDINPNMVIEAQKNDASGTYELIKSAHITSPNQYYDLVFASWVLMEIATKKELINILQEIYRVLKKGGVFITVVCSKYLYNRNWLSLNTEFIENIDVSSGSRVKVFFKDINLTIYDYFWSDDDYREVIANSGGRLIKAHDNLGTKHDGYQWINEQNYPPFTTYISCSNK